ncbi:similar to An02g03990 [Aspergillus niger]|uniref:Similar to An02g03990 n=1 Tax=Aspergillus niger TaxID=5061 RepID=A0A117DWT6_ASPNG|nr:similar to An02g03990 [Aspergillus niger]
MFNPNIPTPNPGRRQGDPIVIADDDEDEDLENDYSGEVYFQVYEGDEDALIRELDLEESESAEDDDDMQVEYSLQSSRPQSGIMGFTYPTTPTPNLGPTLYQTTLDQERQIRTRLREDRHAALCVLLDRELLTIQALAHQETLPQARRRFLSRLLAPQDPEAAASIRADRFTVQHPSTSSIASSSSSTVAMIVPRQVVDVYETDDAGWRRPMMELVACVGGVGVDLRVWVGGVEDEGEDGDAGSGGEGSERGEGVAAVGVVSGEGEEEGVV